MMRDQLSRALLFSPSAAFDTDAQLLCFEARMPGQWEVRGGARDCPDGCLGGKSIPIHHDTPSALSFICGI